MAGIEFISVYNKTAYLTSSKEIKEPKSCTAIYNNNNTRCMCNTDSQANNYITITSTATATAATKSKRPLTLCLTIIIMALTLTLTMPTYANAAALRKVLKNDETGAITPEETQKAIERELRLLTSAEELIEEAMKDAINIKHKETKSSSLLESKNPLNDKDAHTDSNADYTDEEEDELDSLDVLKHMQRKEEHMKERTNKLRKRHASNLENLRYFDGSSHQVVWHNPCNVFQKRDFVEQPTGFAFYYLSKFKQVIRNEYNTRTLSLKHIKIDDMESWRLHRDYYTFLPKLKLNSNISLGRWYRNMQIYVASFAYLGRTQYNWDMKKQRYVGETTKELDQLLSSARLILCELETAINGSHPDKNVNILKTLTVDEMTDRLDFQFKEHERRGSTLVEPTILDLKFTKDFYLKYLATMRKLLKRRLTKQNKNRDVKLESFEGDSMEGNNDPEDEDVESINVSSAMRSDSSMSLAESFEVLMKSNNQQAKVNNRRRGNPTNNI